MIKKKTEISPRRVAAEAVIRVESGGAYSNIVIDSALREAGLSGRDAAFATALFYLTVERRLTLKHCVAAFCKHKLSKAVAAILETAVAQLLYMDNVPQSAAVNEAVSLSRAMGQQRSSGLINGVLRSFIRAGCKVPPVEGSTADKMSILYSCSKALCAAFIRWYGEDIAEEILSSALGRAPVYMRVNSLKTNPNELAEMLKAEGITASPAPIDNCLVLEGGDAASTQAYRGGYFHVQDLSSQRAVELLGALPGERVLDVCAAPGGKSFTIAEIMGDSGEIISCDLHDNRLNLIRAGAQRLGLKSISAVLNDGSVPNPELGSFDRILCDVPCSGLGVIRRKPEIKYGGTADFESLPDLQYNILKASSNYLVEGGRLLYTTCTLNPAENEDVVRRFLSGNPDFKPFNFHGEGYFKTFLPTALTGGDGFFIAAVIKGGNCSD